MATQRWTGGGANVKQVGTITVTAYDATTTYRVTMNGKIVGVLGSGGTTTTAATALTAALVASEDPEFQEVSWSSSGAIITATANTAGTPFTATSSVSGGAGTIGAYTATTANASKNDSANAANYTSAVPVSGDTLIFDDGDVDCKWSLGTTFAAVDLAAVIRRDTYRGRIGLPVYSDNGIYEPSYRNGVFTAQTITALTIEQSSGDGPGWMKFNSGATACTLLIKGPVSTGLTPGDEVVWYQGSNAANALNMEGGSFLGAPLAGNTAREVTITAVDASLTLTSGFTWSTSGTLTNTTLLALCNIPACTIDGQNSILRGENAVTAATLTVNEGELVWNSSGTITTLGTVGGLLNFAGDRRAKTATNLVTFLKGSGLRDTNGVVTYTNGIKTNGCRWTDLREFDIGIGRTLTVA